jgi:hypothetical protein
VAPRVRVRLATNIEAALGNSGREIFCQTVNLSSSGMLIRTRHRPPLGTPVVVKIGLPDQFGSICVRGDLVRHASASQGGVDGVAIRFVSFAKDGAEQLQSYLESLNTEPEPDLLTEVESRPEEAPKTSQPKPPPARRVRKSRNPNDPVIIEFE